MPGGPVMVGRRLAVCNCWGQPLNSGNVTTVGTAKTPRPIGGEFYRVWLPARQPKCFGVGYLRPPFPVAGPPPAAAGTPLAVSRDRMTSPLTQCHRSVAGESDRPLPPHDAVGWPRSANRILDSPSLSPVLESQGGASSRAKVP